MIWPGDLPPPSDSSTTFHHAVLESPNGAFAIHDVSGHSMGVGDVAHTRYILNFGANPYESHYLYVPFIQRLIDARINLGAKLVTFDVRISQTAGKSDEWFPIIPGTDGMVVLAMAYVIASEGLWDREFIERWTNTSPARLLRHLSAYTPKKAESHERRPGLGYQTHRGGVCFGKTKCCHRRRGGPETYQWDFKPKELSSFSMPWWEVWIRKEDSSFPKVIFSILLIQNLQNRGG